jgi:nitrogen fixation protein NifZ
MSDIARDGDNVELNDPPRFSHGECVVSRSTVRNDGTFAGADIGDVLVRKGDIGYVTSIGSFLQQYYIYAVEFIDTGHRVGMRAKELMTLDKLPEDILEALGADKVAQLKLMKNTTPAPTRPAL